MLRAVLFDLDGTLLDTGELIAESILYALRGRISRLPTKSEVAARIGYPLRDQLRWWTKLEDVEELVRDYRDYSRRLQDTKLRAYPQAAETLSTLKACGLAIAAVTNKERDSALRGMRLTGLSPFFDAVIAVEDAGRPKPDPAPVIAALDRLGVRPEEAVMIGDSPLDMEAARAAGVCAFGVAWTAWGAARLRESGADAIIADLRELPKLLLTERAGEDGCVGLNGIR